MINRIKIFFNKILHSDNSSSVITASCRLDSSICKYPFSNCRNCPKYIMYIDNMIYRAK